MLVTGKLAAAPSGQSLGNALTRIVSKGGEPLILKGVDYAMRMLGKQFVTGQTIEEALKNGKEREKLGYLYSFDMLGEAAMTEADCRLLSRLHQRHPRHRPRCRRQRHL